MTYSVVARCPDTGRLGIGVQSHYPAVAANVPWLRSGVGAIGTQALRNMMYGARGLDMLQQGVTADHALQSMLASDPFAENRQVAIVDASGAVAAHTGSMCIGHSSHLVGDGVVFQGNVMRHPGVPEAMAATWEAGTGQPLELRIMDALAAAQEAGGDVRGVQAGGIHIREVVPADRWWEGISIDIRVDDHPDPISELRRLLTIARAYEIPDNDVEVSAASLPASAVAELSFWNGVQLANRGDIEGARLELAKAFAVGFGWLELLRRLVPVGLLDVEPEQFELLVAGFS